MADDPILNVTVQLAPGATAPPVDPQMQHLYTVAANAALHVLHKSVRDAVSKHSLNIGPLRDPMLNGIDSEMTSVAGSLAYVVVTALKADLQKTGKTLP